MDSKRLAAEQAVRLIEDGMTIGLGTGSTARYAIDAIGGLVAGGMKLRAVATSVRSERQAMELRIPIVSFAEIEEIDLTIDGADEIDGEMNVIKGGGGALLREKIVAAASRRLIIIADERKLVDRLGAFPLPVEVARFGFELTIRRLAEFGCAVDLRQAEGKPYVTDNGNYIADCRFDSIPNAPALHDEINRIVGVVDNGLFIGMAEQASIGYEDGTVKIFSGALKSRPF